MIKGACDSGKYMKHVQLAYIFIYLFINLVISIYKFSVILFIFYSYLHGLHDFLK